MPRRHNGASLHSKRVFNLAKFMEGKHGDLVRKNQALVDKSGRKISSLRPDVQSWKGNTLVIYEVLQSASMSAARGKADAYYAASVAAGGKIVYMAVHES